MKENINKQGDYTNPKISIIVPVYNVEKYINQALESLVNQSLDNLEFIFIDDCSTDNSIKIVEKYAQNDNRIKIYYQNKNQGQGIARNRGLDLANGDYIMFLDPDDWFELDACEKAYNQITKNQNDIVFFNLYEYKPEKKKRKLNDKRFEVLGKYKDNQNIDLASIKENWLTTSWAWAQIYSKSFLNNNNIRFSNERFTEDLPFFIKSVANTNNISILDIPLYNYRRKKIKRISDYSCYYLDLFSTKQKALEILKESENNTNMLRNYIEYEINSDAHWLKMFFKADKKTKKDFYNRIKEKYAKLANEYDIKIFKNNKSYDNINLILKSKTYNEFMIKRILHKLTKKGKKHAKS